MLALKYELKKRNRIVDLTIWFLNMNSYQTGKYCKCDFIGGKKNTKNSS